MADLLGPTGEPVGSPSEVNMAGINAQAIVSTGGELWVPMDGKGYTRPDPARPLRPAVSFAGPCLILYVQEPDASRVASMLGIAMPQPGDIVRDLGGRL